MININIKRIANKIIIDSQLEFENVEERKQREEVVKTLRILLGCLEKENYVLAEIFGSYCVYNKKDEEEVIKRNGYITIRRIKENLSYEEAISLLEVLSKEISTKKASNRR